MKTYFTICGTMIVTGFIEGFCYNFKEPGCGLASTGLILFAVGVIYYLGTLHEHNDC